MAVDTSGINFAGGLQQGFNMGNQFFDRVDQTRAKDVAMQDRTLQKEREKTLFDRETTTFNQAQADRTQANIVKDIQIGDAQRKDKARQNVGFLEKAIDMVNSGNFNPDEVSNYLIESGIPLDAFFDKKLLKGLKDLSNNIFDSNDINHVKALQVLLGPKLKETIGTPGRDGQLITNIEVIGGTQLINDQSKIVPELRITGEDGSTYEAPLTSGRSSSLMDTVEGIPITEGLQKLTGLISVYELMANDEIKMALLQRVDKESDPYNKIGAGGSIINELTGKVTAAASTAKQPTKASLSFLAASGGPGSEIAQKALNLMDKNNINSLPELSIKATDPNLTAEQKKPFVDAMNMIATVNASVYSAQRTAQGEQTQRTEEFKANVNLLKDIVVGSQKRAGDLADEIDNLRQFEKALYNLEAAGGSTGALAVAKTKALALASEFGIEINDAQLSGLEDVLSITRALTIAGMAQLKGVASESDRMYVEQSTVQITNTANANRRISNFRQSRAEKINWIEGKIQRIAYDDKLSQSQRLQQISALKNSEINYPAGGYIVVGAGDDSVLKELTLKDFLKTKKREYEENNGGKRISGLPYAERTKIQDQQMEEWSQRTSIGLSAKEEEMRKRVN